MPSEPPLSVSLRAVPPASPSASSPLTIESTKVAPEPTNTPPEPDGALTVRPSSVVPAPEPATQSSKSPPAVLIPVTPGPSCEPAVFNEAQRLVAVSARSLALTSALATNASDVGPVARMSRCWTVEPVPADVIAKVVLVLPANVITGCGPPAAPKMFNCLGTLTCSVYVLSGSTWIPSPALEPATASLTVEKSQPEAHT